MFSGHFALSFSWGLLCFSFFSPLLPELEPGPPFGLPMDLTLYPNLGSYPVAASGNRLWLRVLFTGLTSCLDAHDSAVLLLYSMVVCNVGAPTLLASSSLSHVTYHSLIHFTPTPATNTYSSSCLVQLGLWNVVLAVSLSTYWLNWWLAVEDLGFVRPLALLNPASLRKPVGFPPSLV